MKIQDIIMIVLLLTIITQIAIIIMIKKERSQYIPQMCMSRYLYDGQGNPIACKK